MSAFVTVAYDDRIELLTDGAFYAADGTLTKIGRKVWMADNLPMAFTGRGSAAVEAFAVVFGLVAGSCTTVDDALDAIAAAIARRVEKGVPVDAEVIICAISETRGPSIFYFATGDFYGGGVTPWKLIQTDSNLFGGPPIDVSDLYVRDGLAGEGVEIFERMRGVPGPSPTRPDLPDVYGIGGHVDLTVVRLEGCTTERLRTWPDVVGQKIVPCQQMTGG